MCGRSLDYMRLCIYSVGMKKILYTPTKPVRRNRPRQTPPCGCDAADKPGVPLQAEGALDGADAAVDGTSSLEGYRISANEMSRMFRAFSDHTRLRILSLLAEGEVCVCDLVQVLRISQPKVSRHLAYLRRAGLVKARRQGLWMHYRLTAAQGRFHQSLLHCLGDCFADAPQLVRDRAAMEGIRVNRAGLAPGGTGGNGKVKAGRLSPASLGMIRRCN